MRNRVNEIILGGLVVALAGSVLPQKSFAWTTTRTYTRTTVTTTAQPVTVRRTYVNRVIERPVVVERTYARPAVVERVIERPVIVRRYHTGLVPGVYHLIFGG